MLYMKKFLFTILYFLASLLSSGKIKRKGIRGINFKLIDFSEVNRTDKNE